MLIACTFSYIDESLRFVAYKIFNFSGIGSCSKLGGAINNQETFVWRNILFLWSHSKH